TPPATPLTYPLSLHDALPIYSLERTRLVLGLDAEYAQDLDAILGRVAVEVVVEESVDDLRLGGYLPDPRDPCLQFFFGIVVVVRSEEHTSELQSRGHLVCRLL